PYQGLRASAASRSVTIESTRARISSILAKSAISAVRKRSSSDIPATLVCRIMKSFLTMLVQASLTRSSSASRELGQVGSGVVVIPSAGMKCVSLERRNSFDSGEFRLLKISVGHRDEARSHRVTVVGRFDSSRKY